MRDYETAAAIKAKWDATPALMRLVPGGLREPPVVESQASEAVYATLTVKKDSRPNQPSSVGEIDFRRVRIVVHGVKKADVAAAGKLIDEVFGEQSLTIDNADHMRTERPPDMAGGTIERAKRTQEGERWQAILEFRVWTSRPKAATSS